MPQTYLEKIIQRYSVDLNPGQRVRAGDTVFIEPAYVMTHDNSGAVIPKFRELGAQCVANPRQAVFTLDHDIQNTSQQNLDKYTRIADFASEMGIDFYPAGRGIGHQIMVEEGYAWPGTLVVASDSHSNMYGGIGCLGTPVVRTDAAAIWATGKTWWQIPPVSKVILHGSLQPGVTGKDVIITLCGLFNNDDVLNHLIEFTGDGVAGLTVSERLTIANMTTEWGALAGVFPCDERTLEWLEQRYRFLQQRGLPAQPSDADGGGVNPRFHPDRMKKLQESQAGLKADRDAFYTKTLTLDLKSVQPHISGPDSVKKMIPVSLLRSQKIRINKAYLLSCVNSRVDDLAQAAEIVRGKQITDGVDFFIAAASNEVQAESEQRGDWQALLAAGATPLPPGCGPCIGMGTGLLKDGEVGISATNRNFKGRMGSSGAQTYLASPAVVAASALTGYIDYPGDWQANKPNYTISVNKNSRAAGHDPETVPGFPESIRAEVVFCNQDNLNTDGIYPGKYTYVDNMSPEQQADVAMQNYDPEFANLIKNGDILATGYNFGTGSSREQAATALKYKGIRLVIAGSFSATYKRNALNNGFLTLESPAFINELKLQFGDSEATVRTGIDIEIDFSRSSITTKGDEYPVSRVDKAARQLIADGGLAGWIRTQLS